MRRALAAVDRRLELVPFTRRRLALELAAPAEVAAALLARRPGGRRDLALIIEFVEAPDRVVPVLELAAAAHAPALLGASFISTPLLRDLFVAPEVVVVSPRALDASWRLVIVVERLVLDATKTERAVAVGLTAADVLSCATLDNAVWASVAYAPDPVDA